MNMIHADEIQVGDTIISVHAGQTYGPILVRSVRSSDRGWTTINEEWECYSHQRVLVLT